MLLKLTVLAVTLLAVSPATGQRRAPAAAAAPVRASEAAVRAMPLEQRPNRIGHFYGNNVRRVQQRTLCVNCGKAGRPMARFFYVSR